MSEKETKQHAKLYDLNPAFFSGDLFKYDPRDKISSLIRKNIIISCKKTAKTVQKLSDEFGVSLAIMKDEIHQIPEDFLKKINGDKYIANSIVIDLELQEKTEKLTADIAADYFKEVKEYLLSKKDEIMALPYINPPKSFEYLLWWYLPQFADSVKWTLEMKIAEKLKENNIKTEERKALYVCFVSDPEKERKSQCKNHNGISNVFNLLGQHEEVRIDNMHIEEYIPWSKGRFWAGQNFNDFPELAMVFKTIDGLDVDAVEENDKEATAKALEKGYIKKENGKLYPEVTIATEYTVKQLNWLKYGTDVSGKYNEITAIAEKYADKIADKLWDYANKYLPEHLIYLSKTFANGVLNLEYYLYGEGVKDGILYELPETGCTEGIMASIYSARLGLQYAQPDKDGVFIAKIEKINENSTAEKMGIRIGDILIDINGVNYKDYQEKIIKSNPISFWKDGDVITVDRNGEKIDFTVSF